MSNLSHIASLTNLTKLELSVVNFPPLADGNPFQKLSLLELSLMECSGIAEILIMPSTLPTLQKLHVVESSHMKAIRSEVDEIGGEAVTLKYRQLRAAVFSLPSLVELSGHCRYLMPYQSDGWRRCSECQCEHKNDETEIPFVCRCDQVWRKLH